MAAPIGLYYPYTHFRDPNWLKLAALYWPKMARIAPLGYDDAQNTVARALRDDLDFILDLDPGSALDAAGTTTLTVLKRHSRALRQRYRIPERKTYVVGGASNAGSKIVSYRFPSPESTVTVDDPLRRWPGPVAGPITDQTFTHLIGLHTTKVKVELFGLLQRNRLAITDSRLQYAAVHPNFAWAYMCVLADEVARRNGLVPLSDDPSAYEACGDWTEERLAAALLGDGSAPVARHLRTEVGLLALRLAVPDDLAAVPVHKIVAIRKRYGAEFDAFHELVADVSASFSAELAEVSDPSVLEAYLGQAVAARFDRPLEDLRKAMRGLGVDTALSSTAIKFELPAAAAALAGGLAASQPVLATAGAAFGVASWYRSARAARRDAVAGTPVGYLWRVERGVGGKTLLDRLLRR
jgi:hypothetical protein